MDSNAIDETPRNESEPATKPKRPPRKRAASPSGNRKRNRGDSRDSREKGAAKSDDQETPDQVEGKKPETDSEFRPETTPDARTDSEKGDRNEGEGPGSDSESGGGASSEEERREQRRRFRRSRKERRKEQREREREREAAMLDAAPSVEVEGLTEISPKGFGFLRLKSRGYQQHPDDVFITPEVVRVHGLRDGLLVKCLSKQGARGPQLVEILTINGREPKAYHNLPYFEELTAINPNKRLTLETRPDRLTTRVIDMMTPIGRGQRGLIVAPPRTGKTTFLEHIAEAVLENYEDQMHLIVMLIDERPEEVTNFQRLFPQADLFASSNDAEVKDHTRMAQLAIERAKRLVEAGEHVFILLDSITRLARAFNNAVSGGKKGKNRGTQSGGIAVGALEIPRKLFAAARNTREGGSLTIIATALIQTNFKMDEAIFQEFKGTGNMELVLDRQLAQNYVYPAVDIHRSGTRREELLLPTHMLEKIYVIRRGLAGYKPVDAMEWLIKCMERYPGNAQMLMDIKVNALA
ncbi:MAG: transcription termination factor Rho [Verrucomicrobiae bacterium]|nr:transcription termination factor Rho [Verrucomicrobiae bacterium]